MLNNSRVVALAVAGALSFGAVAAPVTSAQVAEPTAPVDGAPVVKPAPVASGEMTWPIKESFLNYVQGFAGGKITVSDGAKAVTDGTTVKGFSLPVDPQRTDLDKNGYGLIGLQGTLQFQGHEGLGPGNSWGMDLTYSNLQVAVSATTTAIYADYEVKGGLPGKTVKAPKQEEVAIAVFDTKDPFAFESGATKTWENRIPTLTQAGEDSLLSYRKGTELTDGPVNLSVTFSTDGEPGPTPDIAEPQTFDYSDGSSLNKKTLIGAGVGLGLVVALLAAVGAWFQGLIPGLPAPQLPKLPF